MTANELADELVWMAKNRGDSISRQLADIVRQQQSEIGRLKQIIDANNLNQNIGQFVKPANEPVAWMDGEGGFYHNDDYKVCKEHNIADDLVPLYTHPMRELSDEEIWKLWQTHLNDEITVFARELLKKAREK